MTKEEGHEKAARQREKLDRINNLLLELERDKLREQQANSKVRSPALRLVQNESPDREHSRAQRKKGRRVPPPTLRCIRGGEWISG